MRRRNGIFSLGTGAMLSIWLSYQGVHTRLMNPYKASMQILSVAFTSTATLAGDSSANMLIVTAIIAVLGTIGAFGGAFAVSIVAKILKENRRVVNSRQSLEVEKSDEYYLKRYREKLCETMNYLEKFDRSEPLQMDTCVPIKLLLRPNFQELPVIYEGNKLEHLFYQHADSLSPGNMPPETLLKTSQSKYFVFLGEIGSGKTTLLKYLARRSAQGKLDDLSKLDLPICINLSGFAESGSSDLKGFAADNWEADYQIPRANAIKIMDEYIASKRVLFLLDGLDETLIGEDLEEAEKSYKRVLKAIKDLAQNCYQAAHIIITARQAIYRQLAGKHLSMRLDSFTVWEVLPFSEHDIRQFIEKWFVNYDRGRKQRMIERLNAALKRRNLRRLASNPLLLALIVNTFEAKGGNFTLPENRASIYKLFIDTLLEKWDEEKGIKQPQNLDKYSKERLLAKIAWHFHQRGRYFFDKEDLNVLIRESVEKRGLTIKLREPNQTYEQQILEEITNRHGLLKELSNDRYCFLHPSIQEYFAAWDMPEESALRLLDEPFDEDWWSEVIILRTYLSRTQNSGPFFERLLTQRDQETTLEDIFQRNLLLAGRLLTTHSEVSNVQLRAQTVAKLLDLLKDTPYSLTRQQVVEVLVEIGEDQQATSKLFHLLQNEQISQEVKQCIASGLSSSADNRVSGQLLSLLNQGKVDRTIQRRIIETLGIQGDASSVQDLFNKLYMRDTDNEIANAIIQSICSLYIYNATQETRIIQGFLNILGSDCNAYMQCQVARALGAFAGLMVPRALLDQLKVKLNNQKIDPSTRQEIARVIGMLSAYSNLEVPYIQAIFTDLKQLLRKERDSEVRCAIINTLTTLSDRSADTLALFSTYLRNPRVSSNIRACSALALGKLDQNDTTFKSFLNMLWKTSLEEEVQIAVVQALGNYSIQQVYIDEFFQLLEYKGICERAKICIVRITGLCKDPSIPSRLLTLLQNSETDGQVRETIADVLGEMGASVITPGLVRIVENSDCDIFVRAHVAYALGLLGEPYDFQIFIDLLQNDSLNLYLRHLIAINMKNMQNSSYIFNIINAIDSYISKSIRIALVRVVANLAETEEDILQFANLLFTSDLADYIHQALWLISYRTGFKIFSRVTPAGKKIVVKPPQRAFVFFERTVLTPEEAADIPSTITTSAFVPDTSMPDRSYKNFSNDVYTYYLDGMARLLELVKDSGDQKAYQELLLLDMRLGENISTTRLHGSDSTQRTIRYEILQRLIALSIQTTGKSFKEWCNIR